MVVFERVFGYQILCSAFQLEPSLTQRQLLPRVRGEGEAKDRHAGDQDAGDDEVAEVVESPPAYLDGEGDVEVRSGTTLVTHLVPLCRDS